MMVKKFEYKGYEFEITSKEPYEVVEIKSVNDKMFYDAEYKIFTKENLQAGIETLEDSAKGIINAMWVNQ